MPHQAGKRESIWVAWLVAGPLYRDHPMGLAVQK